MEVISMSKKMAVKNRQASTNKAINWNSLKLPLRSIKVVVILAVIVMFSLLLSKTSGLWSEILPIEKIAIVGKVEHIDQKQLTNILQMNDFSGMLFVDLYQLRKKVIRSPWVEDVQIRKVWPDTLSFIIKEHQPIAYINRYYLTTEGGLIKQGNYQSEQEIVRVTLASLKKYASQDLLDLVAKVNSIQSLLTGLKFRIENLVITESDSWSFELEDSFKIKVGRKHQQQRIESFVQVYAAIENKQQLESVDLRYSNGLAVKLKKKVSQLRQNG